jgi:phosphoglycolate phosphatase
MHLIFDLDGTLFNSHNQIIQALAWVRKMHNFPLLSENEVKNLIGLSAKQLFSDLNLATDQLEMLVIEFRHRLKIEIALRNETYPEVTEILTELKTRGFQLSVATTKPTELAKWTIKHSSLDGIFNHIQGTDDFEPKPSPEVIIRCIRLFPGENVFMFGDRREDMQAAVSAGVTGIGIAQTVHDSTTLKLAGATATIPEFRLIRNLTELM